MSPAAAGKTGERQAGLTVDTKTPNAEDDLQFADGNEAEDSPGTLHESPAGEADEDGSRPAPLQKRRRVTRACDECRRKKIKCDGKQPCTHCTVYSYECTYDQPSNRRRNAPQQYVESLEAQLKRAQAVLNLVMPNANLEDPDLESKVRRVLTFSPSPMRSTPPLTSNNTFAGAEDYDSEIETHLESMVKSTGQLDLDEQGNLEYHGHSSGLTFMRRMRESLGNVRLPEGKATPFVKSRPMSQVFDSPRSLSDSPWDINLPGSDLPPREVAREMCDLTINDAGALLRFIHYPTFMKQVDRMYDVSPENYGNEENMFLPLFYAVLAVATLFKGTGESFTGGYEVAINEGFKYFRQCRQLMDIADCRDLRQLQALVFMIIFLQSSAKLSVCYAYIGVALRSALRLGLHRCFNENFTPIEAETRKRVFWVIRKMDTYVGALLGLPHALGDDQIDQELPTPVDDEYITETAILPMPESKVSIMTAANAHTRLVQILSKIVEYIYPVKASRKTDAHGNKIKSYSVSYSKIMEIEQDLRAWHDELPMGLRPGGDAPRVILRCQHLLRMAFAHAQMMLYRPFLHYVSQARSPRHVDKRSYACAAACVSVSRNIVHIAVEMKKRGLLGGAYWFSMYTTFFAILSLVFYALENPENEASKDVLQVAKEGRDTLASLAAHSMAADRCNETLKCLFEQLPNGSKPRFAPGKKRRQEGPHVRFEEDDEQPISHDEEINYAGKGLKPDYAPESKFQPSHEFFDMNNGFATPTTPSLASGFSISQQESLPGSPLVGNPSFPLADMTSMMFPNPDPFAYPNQQSGADAKFDDLLKNLQTNGPPIQVAQEQYQLEQPAAPAERYVPLEQQPYLMYQDLRQENRPRPSNAQEADVQLLGPMPMYMMQGTATGDVDFNSYEGLLNSSGNTPTESNGSPSQHEQQQHVSKNLLQQTQTTNHANHTAPVKRVHGGNPPNVNLDDLLGGSEWAGLPADRSVVGGGGYAGPMPPVMETAGYGNVGKVEGIVGSAAPGTTLQGPYQDVNSLMSWGLEGY